MTRPKNTMLKATLYLQHKDDTDDVIRIWDSEDGMYDIVYEPYDVLLSKYSFRLSYPETMRYIRNILKGLESDVEPPEFVQVMTPVFPSVLYHIADVSDKHVRYRIEDAIDAALLLPVRTVKRNVRDE